MFRLTVVASSLVLGLLLSMSLQAQEVSRSEPSCTTFSEPPVDLCRDLDVAALLNPGSSTVMRLWVKGTRDPVEIRIHNSTPSVIRVEGGPDQIVRTSGGEVNEIRIPLTSLVRGQSVLQAHPYLRDPARESVAIAGELTRALSHLKSRFAGTRGKLPVVRLRPSSPPAYSAEVVSALIDATERELLNILSYPELAGMRDHVREEIRQVRAELARRDKRSGGLASPEVVLASLAPMRLPSPSLPVLAKSSGGTATVSKEAADSVLDRVGGLIDQLLQISRKDDLLMRLCVTSLPKAGAKFRMHPQSYPEGGHETMTTGELVNVYRGRYVYEAELGRTIRCQPKPGEDSLKRCQPLDLVNDRRLLLECDFKQKSCTRRDGPIPQGACHGGS